VRRAHAHAYTALREMRSHPNTATRSTEPSGLSKKGDSPEPEPWGVSSWVSRGLLCLVGGLGRVARTHALMDHFVTRLVETLGERFPFPMRLVPRPADVPA
jgi:hypothetical protein